MTLSLEATLPSVPTVETSQLLSGMRVVLDLLTERPTDDEGLLALAFAAAMRADCTRRKVGAVVVDAHGRVVGTGRNGAPPKAPGCWSDAACPRGRLTYEQLREHAAYDDPGSPGYCTALHAEANALLFSDASARRGGTMAITDQPCPGCRKLLMGSGLSRVIWPGFQWVIGNGFPA